jgi:tetratricopeptide (TPR) repeat protein
VSARERLLFDVWTKTIVERDFPAAEKLTDEYLKAYPGEPEGYQFRAAQLMKSGHSDKAMEVYTRLLAVNPNHAIAYNNTGYYWMGRGDFQKAEDNLKRYRFLAPDQANPYDSLGELYANTGRYEEAEENLRKALELKPDFVASVGHLGIVAVGRGRFAEAAALYEKAAKLSEDLGSATNFALAEALCTLESGDRAKALALVDASLVPLSEPSPRTKGLRATALLARAAIAGEGISDAVQAAPPPEESSGDSRAQRDRAVGLLRSIEEVRRGGLESARAFVLKELPAWKATGGEFGTYYPHLPMLWVRLAEALGRAGAPGEAAEILKAVLERNPRFQPALDVQTRVRGEAGARNLAAAPGA